MSNQINNSTIGFISSETINVMQLIADSSLESAYQWLCTQRENSSHNNSVWDVRFNWVEIKPRLKNQLQAGIYRLSPLQSYQINGEFISSWVALDALVLKALTLTLQPLFSPEQYQHCTHLKDTGGIHSAVEEISHHKESYKHILKSDAYHYYESIDHEVLLTLLSEQIACEILLDLVKQYCQRLEINNGLYTHFTQGIPKGCPLSPLMAALYLKPLDDEMKKQGFYVRFMDDWVIMVKTKYQLRKVIKLTHKILTRLKLKMHPDKTFIGCIKKGFDFLGIHFGELPTISKISLENHQTKIAQRYAQGASNDCIGHYVVRWSSWCKGLLARCRCESDVKSMNKRCGETTLMVNLLENKNENTYFYNKTQECLNNW